MKRFTILLCGIGLAVAGFAESKTLTLQQTLELARQNSPELRAARLHSQAAEKGVGAAGLWKNPTLEFEAEGLGWDNDLFSEGEYTIGLKQEFQRGGKQKKERAVAAQSVGVASQAILEKELELSIDVQRAFIELMFQQESGKVREEQEELGRAFVKVAKKRHNVGGGSELAVVQAELALEEIILSQTCCFGDLLAAKEALAALIGIPMAELAEVTSPYYELESLAALSVAESSPSLRRLEAEAEKLRAEAQWAKAQDSANIFLGAGYRYEAAIEANSLVFSASMPLSFSKRGRVEHAAGMLSADAVQAERDEVRRKLQQELSTGLALYSGAMAEVDLTKKNLIPKATQAYELSRDGYNAGRFSWLELIAAQQNLADIRIRSIESLRDAHLARAQLSKFIKEGV